MEKNSKLCVPLWKDIHGLFFGACPKNMPPYKSWDWRTSLIDAFARIIFLTNCTKKPYTCWTHVSDMMAVPEGRCHQTFKFDKVWLIMRVANSGNAWPIDQTLAERQNTWSLDGRCLCIPSQLGQGEGPRPLVVLSTEYFYTYSEWRLRDGFSKPLR